MLGSISRGVRRALLLALLGQVLCGVGAAYAQTVPPAVGALLEIGNAALAKGDYDAAIASFTRVIEVEPGHAGAIGKRAAAFRAKGDYSKALDDHVKLLATETAATQAAAITANPGRFPDQPFLLAVEDVFTISGVGGVVVGKVVRGEVRVGQEVEIVGVNATRQATMSRMEKERKLIDLATAGDYVGLILRGVTREDVKRGVVLAAPGTLKPHSVFEAEVYLLTKEQGGRATSIAKNYRPQIFLRTSAVSGTVTDIGGGETVDPGQRAKFTIELRDTAALEPGLLFGIVEGGRTVGLGIVAKITK